jgi:hypothetical protein
MLLAESPEREQRRRELIAQKKSLNEGLQVLDELHNKYQDAPVYQQENGIGEAAFGPPFSTPPVEKMQDGYDDGTPRR